MSEPTPILYVGDPMCSWCWGFDPELRRLRERRTADVDVQVVVGGLRPDDAARPLTELRDYLRATWSRIAATTGQPFDTAFLDREGFLYDTGPACRAVVAARRIGGGEAALATFGEIQRGFYAEGRDPTEPDVLVAAAGRAGLPADGFRAALMDGGTRRETASDYARARALGVTGFPTLIAAGDGRPTVVARGWCRAADVEAALDAL